MGKDRVCKYDKERLYWIGVDSNVGRRVNDSRNDWRDYLNYVLIAHTAITHDSTHCSPNLLVPGREMNFNRCYVFILLSNSLKRVSENCDE